MAVALMGGGPLVPSYVTIAELPLTTNLGPS